MPKKRNTKVDNDATSTDHFLCPRCAYMDKKAVEVFHHIRSEHGVKDTFLVCSDPCFETGHFMKAQESTETPVKTETPKPTGKKRKKKKKKVQANSSSNDDLTEESVEQQSDSTENNTVRAADETVTPNPKKNQEGQPWDVEILGSLENQTMSTNENCSAQPSNGGLQKTGSTNDEAKIDGKGSFVGSSVFQAVENALIGPLPEFHSWIDAIRTHCATASPDSRNERGQTPLLYSLHLAKDHSCIAQFEKRLMRIWHCLLEEGASARIKDEEDRSLLHLLLNFLQTGVFQPDECLQLISHGLKIFTDMPIRSRDANGNTPLHLWGSYSNKPIDSVLEIGAKIILSGGAANASNDNGETPLHLSQSWKVVDFLVEEGAQTDAQDLHGNTPLHNFIGTFVGDMVEEDRWKCCLLSGMDPFSKDKRGKCPFELLLEKGCFKSGLNLMKAIFEEVKLAGFAESASDYRDCKGNSLLHILCVIDNEDAQSICEYLLQKRWSVNLQNKCNETRLHMVCKKVGNVDLAPSQVMRDAISLLRKYHADVTLLDGQGKTCKEMLGRKFNLRNLLYEDIEKFNFPNKIPWIQQSIKHERALAEVAGGMNVFQVDSLYHHNDCIGKGTISSTFVALNGKDGRELALKRFESARLKGQPEVLKTELECLLRLRDSRHIVSYILSASDPHFNYLAFELFEGTVVEFRSSQGVSKHELTTACAHTASGLESLHSMNIIHQNLRPSKVLFSRWRGLIFKISYFSVGRMLTSSASSGQTETVARELKADDVFSCGLLFHYILTGKPRFGSNNPQETGANIRGNRLNLCSSLTPEARQLLRNMLKKEAESRPTAASLQNFPFFWDDRTKVRFLTEVGNQEEFEKPRSLRQNPTLVETKLERAWEKAGCVNWTSQIGEVHDAVKNAYPRRSYDTRSGVELVRFIRSAYIHVQKLPSEIRDLLLKDFIFLKCFPFLVVAVYDSVKACDSWKEREALKEFFQ